MCSITFWPSQEGYRVGMNRDESLTRIAGLPPTLFQVGERSVLHPREPGGGTWISVNDHGVGIALVNGYSIHRNAPSPPTSRGGVVWAARDCIQPMELPARLNQLPLNRMNPFRVIGIFPAESRIQEWRWDLLQLHCVPHTWHPRQWLSSGYDEATAQRVRGETFDAMRNESDAGTTPWLRRLHASHHPEAGPFSICMHRTDAATVSYTEIEVSSYFCTMGYSPRPLCGSAPPFRDTPNQPSQTFMPASGKDLRSRSIRRSQTSAVR